MKQLTKSQQKVYDFLKEHVASGIPPTVREICAATGLKSTSTVHLHLKALEQMGYISRGAGLNRAIQIQGVEQADQIPIIGRVTAGMPILAVEEVTGYLPFSSEQRRGRDLFALEVRGDSMVNAGILDGDYVVVEKRNYASDGEIVVALIEDEATVKRFFREDNRVRLQPENPAYEPIYAKEVFILGTVTALIRYY